MTPPVKREGLAAKPIHTDLRGVHIHYSSSLEDSTEHDLKDAKTFRKKTTIRAVQVGCSFEVQTLEGLMKGKANDWLAVGVNGELYPIADDIFKKTYEKVESKATGGDELAEAVEALRYEALKSWATGKWRKGGTPTAEED